MLSSDFNCITIAAGDVKAYQVIQLPEIETNVQVLIPPHRKAGHTEIMYNGRPYIYRDEQKLLLITKPAGHE